MFSLFIACEPHDQDLLSAALWEAGTQGILEETGGLRAFFDDAIDPENIRNGLGRPAESLRQEPATDWTTATRESFPPLAIGRRWFLAPPWNQDPAPEGRLRLEINPGMACGTGWHPCTQLCLEAMESIIGIGATVLDVGCGSGILCQAAMLLGAAKVFGCDIDPEAVGVAAEKLNGQLFTGSVDAIRTASMDAIVANISSAVAEDLAIEFRRVLKPGGRLILSGFPDQDLPEGFAPRQRLQQGEWVCLVV